MGRAPAYRSRFGGFWTDRGDTEELLAARCAEGRLSDEEAGYLRHWIDHGFVVIEGAADHDAIDQVLADIEDLWTSNDPRIWVDYIAGEERHLEPVEPRHKDMQVKLLDAYAWSAAAQKVVFSEKTMRFLRLVFEAEPMAFQSLYFERGTQQPMHRDTCFVWVRRPLEFVGSWVAMEDIAPRSGELEYYGGSHRIPEHVFEDGTRRMPDDFADMPEHPGMLHRQAAEMDLPRLTFRPKKGDVVIWHSDLVHGGSQDWDPSTTRRSLVTHYTPVDNAPDYFAKQPHSGRRRHPSGAFRCWPVRGAATALGRARLKAVRFGKQALVKLRG
jgi:ectoine hydroxylase-related dioxygenase (phytanoyl-CoA dioxygenase family)